MNRTRICLLASSLMITLPAGGQPAGLTDALRACLGLTDNLARLTCYDELARQVPAAAAAAITAPAAAPADPVPATPTASVAETATVAAPERTSVATFGQPAARVELAAEGGEVLVDTIVEARRVEPTKWLLTLRSGQVWRQSVGKSYLIRPGDKVRIQASSWGSDFRLSVDGRRGYIQVKRQE